MTSTSDLSRAANVTGVRFSASGGGDVEAYLVEPASAAVVGAVLFLHWFDPQADDGNRTQFVAEAEELAGQGVLCLLPQLVFPWSAEPTDSAADGARIEAELANLRAGVDLLESRGAQRIALVGHDFGAMHGALLMARDRRLRAGVLIAPANRWADWFLRFWSIAEDRIDYQRALRRLDPIEHIASVAPAALLLQFAEQDYFVAGMDASELYLAASEPKRLERYESDHGLRHPQARADRVAFLLSQLA